MAFFVRQNVEAPVSGRPAGATASMAAYEDGYQAGQDDMVRAQDDEAVQVTRPAETGTHGHTEVIPRTGDIYE